MTVSELIEYLSRPGMDPNAKVLVDVKPWDEALNLTELVGGNSYAASGHGEGFVVLTPSTDGATRLDPNAD